MRFLERRQDRPKQMLDDVFVSSDARGVQGVDLCVPYGRRLTGALLPSARTVPDTAVASPTRALPTRGMTAPTCRLDDSKT